MGETKEWHGMAHTRVYSIWNGMKKRCRSKNPKMIKMYAAKGIKVCARWNKFSAFYEDMGDPPDGYTLDRIDNDKGYSPDNCRWATYSQQNWNQRKQLNRTSGVRGVYWDASVKTWKARFGGKYLGSSVSLHKAIKLRKLAEDN